MKMTTKFIKEGCVHYNQDLDKLLEQFMCGKFPAKAINESVWEIRTYATALYQKASTTTAKSHINEVVSRCGELMLFAQQNSKEGGFYDGSQSST